MKLSTRSRYGLRFLLELAGTYKSGAVRTLHDIATCQEISEKYLWSLVPPLKNAGYIETARGSSGGYRLARDPGTITLRSIVEILDGGIDLAACSGKHDACSRYPHCIAAPIWAEVTKGFDEVLERYSLAEILRREKLLHSEAMYFI